MEYKIMGLIAFVLLVILIVLSFSILLDTIKQNDKDLHKRINKLEKDNNFIVDAVHTATHDIKNVKFSNDKSFDKIVVALNSVLRNIVDVKAVINRHVKELNDNIDVANHNINNVDNTVRSNYKHFSKLVYDNNKKVMIAILDVANIINTQINKDVCSLREDVMNLCDNDRRIKDVNEKVNKVIIIEDGDDDYKNNYVIPVALYDNIDNSKLKGMSKPNLPHKGLKIDKPMKCKDKAKNALRSKNIRQRKPFNR